MKKPRFGIVGPIPGEPVDSLIKFALKCEKGGFDSLWFPDHVVFMAKAITPEVWTIITAAAIRTKSIYMGAISDPHRIHPAILAHRIATMDHLSRGRVLPCLATGENMNLDPYGIKWNKPLSRLREAVKVMRGLWREDDTLDFEGEFYRLSKASLRIKPLRQGGVPIYVAATGPRALRVAGEIGDGWVTNAMPSRVFAKLSKIVKEGAEGERRNFDEIDKCIYVFTSLAKDEDEAYEALNRVKHALIWPELLGEAGYDIQIAQEYQGLQYTKILPTQPEMLGKFKEMGERYFSREIVLDFNIAGDKNHFIKKVEEYVEAGVNHFIFRDFSPNRSYAFRVLTKEVIPYFR